MLAKLLILLGLIHICRSALDPKIKSVLDLTLPSYLHLPDLVFPNTTSCKGFWKSTGLACDQSLLTTYAKIDRDVLTQAEKDMNSTFDLMASLLVGVTDEVIKSDYTSSNVDQYVRPSIINRFKIISSRCWNHIKTLRQNSLCSTCSGTNFNFYKGYKAAISLADCDSMLASCKSLFTEVLTFFTPINMCWHAVSFMAGPTVKITYPKDPLDAVSSELHTLLKKSFQNMNTEEVNRLKAQICEGSLRINSPPMLQAFALKFRTELDTCNAEVAKLRPRLLGINRTPFRDLFARQLETSPDWDQQFSDKLPDTFVVQQRPDDPNSYVTPNGCPFSGKPINTSLTFA